MKKSGKEAAKELLGWESITAESGEISCSAKKPRRSGGDLY